MRCAYGTHCVPMSSLLGHSLLERERRLGRLQSKCIYWLIELLRVRVTTTLPEAALAVTALTCLEPGYRGSCRDAALVRHHRGWRGRLLGDATASESPRSCL